MRVNDWDETLPDTEPLGTGLNIEAGGTRRTQAAIGALVVCRPPRSATPTNHSGSIASGVLTVRISYSFIQPTSVGFEMLFAPSFSWG